MQPDKSLHIAAGAAVAVITTAAAAIIGDRLLFPESAPVAVSVLAMWLGFFAALLAGLFKERYDRRHDDHHTYDGWDAYATVAGALFAPVGIGLAVLVSPLV